MYVDVCTYARVCEHKSLKKSKSDHRYAWHDPEVQSCSHDWLWGRRWYKDYIAHCQLTGSLKIQLQLYDITPLPECDSACLGPQQLLFHIRTGVFYVNIFMFLFPNQHLWRNTCICKATFGNEYELLGNISRVFEKLIGAQPIKKFLTLYGTRSFTRV